MPATMDATERFRHGLRAAGLSGLAGLGHLYIGEKKGLRFLAGGLGLLVCSRYLWSPAILLYMVLVAYCAHDAFTIVRDGGRAP